MATCDRWRLLVFQFLCISCSLRVTLSANKLLLLLVDGMRWDYADRENLPAFKQIEIQGARATKMRPNFPSSSYPNYYSIMTGLHCENHGMVSNFMYDLVKNETFDIGNNPESYDSFWWEDAEPLWIGVERQGKKSFLLSWPTCNVTIHQYKPSVCREWSQEPLQNGASLKEDLKEAVASLRNNSADFVGVYYGSIDHFGHLYGPDGRELNTALRELDGAVAELLNITSDMRENLNIIILADHGMTLVGEVVNLTQRMDLSDLDSFPIKGSLNNGANVELWPAIDAAELVNKLNNASWGERNFTAYLKKDIPKRFFYNNHSRIAPVVVMADIGNHMTTFASPNMLTFNDTDEHNKTVVHNWRGQHGYDNTENDMHAIFYAIGPNFNANSKVDLINNTDVYQVMCKILGIEAAANNGSWEAMSTLTMFDQPNTSTTTSASPPETTSSSTSSTLSPTAQPQSGGVNAGFVILGLLIVVGLVIVGVCIWKRYRKREYDDLAFLRDDFSYTKTDFTDRDL
ncbi:ectonucleotide pyrophosphatase/phosphodiesterase family member 6-like isoform X1 [Lingula anatina]|uniref:glycerophosphocholine cholinephosphodiesterase n=1 Tax=Lingula anatina TaxID=7574 RepID=A0A1S3JYI2_LINAN|nr:ectonucleotide pyrophosphatase/phosphodiesterase family member 6-like isoform X1 [Lingula anatina]|eukprot:XP_013415124.1 ectonucleotide pyrophosphatase/phosphodiesterase family member 6-like isoform X1 [Lingula anatina]